MIRPPSRLSHLFRWRYLRWVLAVPALPLVLWACNAHPLEAPIPLPEQQNDQYYEVNPIRDIDILFMIDNSPSMAEEQNNLGRNFPAFIDELKKIPGGLPNVHIGVISSDLGAGSTPLMGGCGRVAGDRGILQAKMGCGITGADRFLKSEPNGTANPTVNFTGDLATVFSCMAKLGTNGCGYEHQLQSTRVALYESITMENKGFLRENAFLALIFITDEDDCSAEISSNLFTDDMTFAGTAPSFRCAQVGHVCNGMVPPITAPFDANLADCDSNENGRLIKVQDVVNSIRMVKPRPDQQIIVSGIFGWPNNPAGAQYRYVRVGNDIDFAPICESMDNGQAAAGLRMKKFVESFGTSGSFFPICQNDFRPAMKQIGEKLAAKLGNPCISAPLVDTKPETGIQADCQVVDQVPTGTSFTYTALPRCDRGTPPCWKLAPDATCSESGYKIDVDRAGVLAKPGTQQAIKCLTCASPTDPRCVR